MWWQIQRAKLDDIPAIKQIANQYKNELGFVNRAALIESVSRRELFVATLRPHNDVVGFVNWHARRDGWHTIYELAVHRDYVGRGIGRALLYAVPTPTRLKCTADNPANEFYEGAGMALVRTEQGRKRALNVWERRILSILVKGNNQKIPEIARRSGMAYGTRHTETPRAWPYMVDIEWQNYDWLDYMHKIRRWRPVSAMCSYYEHPDQRRRLYRQIRDLRTAGVLRIMVCPKFAGAVAHIPLWCVVAVSVPSSYAGFVPEPDELTGRHIHLLGGSPHKQRDMITKHDVLSVDGNAHTRAAALGSWWTGTQWKSTGPGTVPYYDVCEQSSRNIVKTLESAATVKQLRLL